jgi:hypothetical protein
MSWRSAQIPNDLRYFTEKLDEIEKLYEASNIQNKMLDGTEPFSSSDVKGLLIEFR